MKFFNILFLTFFAIIFTGCFDILEDIAVNKDGTGTYSLTFDMDQIINDPLMKEMLLEAVKEEAGMKNNEAEKILIDSMIYLKDEPEFSKFKDNKALWESAKMHLMVDEEKGKMFVNFGFDFSEVSDIDAFFQNLKEDEDSQALFSGFNQIVTGSNFVFKKKTLTRLPAEKGDGKLSDNLKDDELMMMKMFMVDSKLKTSYHFPGKVKKSSIPNSVIENNEVIVAIPLLDLMDGKAQMDGEIKFKN